MSESYVKVTITVEDAEGEKTTYNIPKARDVEITTQTTSSNSRYGFGSSSSDLVMRLSADYDKDLQHIASIVTSKEGESDSVRDLK